MKRTELIFEVAEPSDAAAFVDFMTAVAQESDYIVPDEAEISVEATADYFATNLGRDNQLCLLAKVGDEVIACINVKASQVAAISHIGDIFIAVCKPYWGHGIGSLLLEEAITWAQDCSSLRRLSLTVQARNARAVALYEKFGFEIEGTQKRGARTNEGEFLDVYAMAKLIDA